MSRASLSVLAETYFKRMGYDVEKDVIWEGFSGRLQRFDLVVRRDNEQCMIMIKDWKRTVGINMIIGMDKASADVGNSNPIIIAEKFSDHARAYANRRGVVLLTKQDILRRLR